jgi:hypothetical protein
MSRIVGIIVATGLTAASAAFAQTGPLPKLPELSSQTTQLAQAPTSLAPTVAPPRVKLPAERRGPMKFGPGWSAAKCASAQAQGQTTSTAYCPNVPATPVPPRV